MSSQTDELDAFKQAAFEAKRRADQIEKDKIIRQHEREQKRAEREAKRKKELTSKLVAPLVLLLTVLLSLMLYLLRIKQ